MANVMDSADVGMVQAGNRSCFPLNTLPQFSSVDKMRRQNLDGDHSVQTGITGLVDFAHSARAGGGKNFIGP
jgi:hypothetical protein